MNVWRSAAFAVILDPDSMRVLCLERAKTPYRWALPGGKAKLFEGTAKTLRRELREEAQCPCGGRFNYPDSHRAPRRGSYRLHYAPFLAGPRDFEISREHLSAKWLTVDEATTRPSTLRLRGQHSPRCSSHVFALHWQALGGNWSTVPPNEGPDTEPRTRLGLRR